MGLALNICRNLIGASDYAITPYSLDDTPGDYVMAHFSIARDREKLVPFIKAVQGIRPDLKVWVVPWSPPTWMKTNGPINTDNNGYIKAIPQNEPTQATGYPGCFLSGENSRDCVIIYPPQKLREMVLDQKGFNWNSTG